MKTYRVGILGATGAIGQQFVRFLCDHPWFEISLLTASSDSAGKMYSEIIWLGDRTGDCPEEIEDMKIKETSIENIMRADLDLVFGALPSSVSEKILPELSERGLTVIDKSSVFRGMNT